MSVNHYLLPITDAELTSVLQVPERVRGLAEERAADVCDLGTNAVAIMVVTAESMKDPLAFLQAGAPADVAGWVGEYAVEGGRVVTCEVDMGYGPAAYYRNAFLAEVARRLQPWTVDTFARRCDLDFLEEMGVYPTGWHDGGRKESLVNAFAAYRSCVIDAAESGRHLLVWSA
jgi:hypothetical protein